MDRERIELSAKAKLEGFLLQLGYITPEFSSNDKTPSLDGFIRLYNDKDVSAKANLVKMIPVQIKGHFQNFVQNGLNSPIAAILSTSLFWFYCQVYTDGLHIKATEIDTFPLPDFTKVPSEKSAAIRAKYAEYLSDIERNVIQHTTFKEYKLRKSKHLIDQLDDLICPLYGLTAEETEFIKNYEIEFRVEETE